MRQSFYVFVSLLGHMFWQLSHVCVCVCVFDALVWDDLYRIQYTGSQLFVVVERWLELLAGGVVTVDVSRTYMSNAIGSTECKGAGVL